MNFLLQKYKYYVMQKLYHFIRMPTSKSFTCLKCITCDEIIKKPIIFGSLIII